MERRKFIVVAGTGLTAVLSGCNGGDNTNESNSNNYTIDTGTPEALIESFYMIVDTITEDDNVDSVLNKFDPVLHSESLIPVILEQSMGDQSSEKGGPFNNISVKDINTKTLKENLSIDKINETMALGEKGVDDEALKNIAEENSIVGATIVLNDGTEKDVKHFTATENGEWRIIY